MDSIKLNKANYLNNQVKSLTVAINCFEDLHSRSPRRKMRGNPKLVIEHDGPDEREQIPLSMEIDDAFIEAVQTALRLKREVAAKEFNKL